MRLVRTPDANLEVALIHSLWGAQEAMELGVSLFLTQLFRLQDVCVLLQQTVARMAHRRQNPVTSCPQRQLWFNQAITERQLRHCCARHARQNNWLGPLICRERLGRLLCSHSENLP